MSTCLSLKTAFWTYHVVEDVLAQVPAVTLMMPDRTQPELTLHEVLVERFIKLLGLNRAPDAQATAAMRDTLSVELWPIGIALMCERGFDETKHKWNVFTFNA